VAGAGKYVRTGGGGGISREHARSAINWAAHTDAGGLWKRHVSETNVWWLKVGRLVTVSRPSLSDPTHDAPQSVLEHFAVNRLHQTFSPKQD